MRKQSNGDDGFERLRREVRELEELYPAAEPELSEYEHAVAEQATEEEALRRRSAFSVVLGGKEAEHGR